ncbi:MAG TPA: pseudouridine synthase [Terracidiphilus sp.]|jgi:23S rRNA pseudouridine2605 synthase
MPRKSKKSAESQDEVKQQVTNDSAETGSAEQPASATEEPTADRIDQEAEHRLQNESPAPAVDVEAEMEAEAEDTSDEALDFGDEPAETLEDLVEEDETEGGLQIEAIDDEEEFIPAARPPAKLERLQKILSQAGVSSRRHAEELITGGRVQVNGKVVTELGSKADASRDHIRVDGKLLQGAERLRYFVLNKPRGFVTTVSDPEGRPTVMDFVKKMGERLYPVGRLDYLSEGLLLMTNDGDLANKLTKAATGVEKTYLVKVSGQPTEEELERLRLGVSIERGKPGEGRVQTAPASVRQVRQGDNPWYEVVLIEGRNRELRKMFEEIGHFVEKIRRVGYGPLILDQEPGNVRELQAEELAALRLAAEGKWKAPKAKFGRRRDIAAMGKLPTVAPSRPRPAPPSEERASTTSAPGEFASRKPFVRGDRGERNEPYRPGRPQGDRPRPAGGRPSAPNKFTPRREETGTGGAARFGSAKPAWKKDDRGTRPPARFGTGEGDRRSSLGGDRPARSASGGTGRTGAGRTGAGRTGSGSAGGSRTFGARPAGAKPAWDGPKGGSSPRFDKRGPATGGFDRPRSARPEAPRPEAPRAGGFKSASPRAGQFRSNDSRTERPRMDRTGGTRTGGFGRTGSSGTGRPPRSEGAARPYPPRERGARPAGGPAGPGARPFTGSRPSSPSRPGTRPPGGSRPASGGTVARPAGNTGWKPKPSFDAKRKPSSGGGSRPPSKGGPRTSNGRSGPRAGGKRPGGKPSGGKRF